MAFKLAAVMEFYSLHISLKRVKIMQRKSNKFHEQQDLFITNSISSDEGESSGLLCFHFGLDWTLGSIHKCQCLNLVSLLLWAMCYRS